MARAARRASGNGRRRSGTSKPPRPGPQGPSPLRPRRGRSWPPRHGNASCGGPRRRTSLAAL
eukprot:1586273-Pyramimonas_sp.AAC.1